MQNYFSCKWTLVHLQLFLFPKDTEGGNTEGTESAEDMAEI